MSMMTSGGERAGFVARSEPATPRPRLTPRQWETLRVMWERDGSWKEACSDLGIAHNTLARHLVAAYEQLGVSGDARFSGLLRAFKALGWAEGPQ